VQSTVFCVAYFFVLCSKKTLQNFLSLK